MQSGTAQAQEERICFSSYADVPVERVKQPYKTGFSTGKHAILFIQNTENTFYWGLHVTLQVYFTSRPLVFTSSNKFEFNKSLYNFIR